MNKYYIFVIYIILTIKIDTMGKLFISENSKLDVIDGKEVSVKYVAYANSININKSQSHMQGAAPKKFVNTNIIIKAVLEKKADTLTVEQLMQTSDAEVKTFSENMQIDLSEIAVPAFDPKNFKTSMELQDSLEDYYFEKGLKKSVYGIVNWIVKA